MLSLYDEFAGLEKSGMKKSQKKRLFCLLEYYIIRLYEVGENR